MEEAGTSYCQNATSSIRMFNIIEAVREVLEESPVYQRSSEVQQKEMVQEYIRDMGSKDADLEAMMNKEDRK